MNTSSGFLGMILVPLVALGFTLELGETRVVNANEAAPLSRTTLTP